MQNKTDIKKGVTATSLLIALGIIYGDIGTSPLYVLKAIIGDRPIEEILVFGGVSCVFWTLVFQTTIKYVWLTLKADNQGEGGIFSLYSLVRKYGKRLIIPTMIGASALLADGIITPAISVTSAVEGLKMIEGLENLPIVPIVIVIISFVFIFQRLGSQKVGKIFGPMMTVWFFTLFMIGLLQIITYPSVFKILNPYYAYDFLVNYPHGFWLLGAVFLCTTGAEALYSDLGHCGKKNIRITWGFVKICLVVNYAGQATWLLHQGEKYLQGRNPFFEAMPEWFILPGIIIATIAAIIASQALISGAFTLINEAINLNFWLRVGVKQPSESKGQVYIPSVNTLLWIGCVFVVLYFQNSSNMDAAYGLSITLAMLMTSYLLTYFLLYRLKWNKFLVFGLLSVLGIIEISFFIANIVKFKEGGFITIIIGGIFFTVMFISYYGRKKNNAYTKFIYLDAYIPKIVKLSVDENIPKCTTHLVYLTKAKETQYIEDRIIKSIFSKRPKRADIYWTLHINITSQPHTLDYEIEELIPDKMMKIIINIGFRIRPRVELYFKKILEDVMLEKKEKWGKYTEESIKYNTEPDFMFVVIDRFLSVENEFNFRDGILLQAYFLFKKLEQSNEKAFGLDKSDVLIELFPLSYQPVQVLNLKKRIK